MLGFGRGYDQGANADGSEDQVEIRQFIQQAGIQHGKERGSIDQPTAKRVGRSPASLPQSVRIRRAHGMDQHRHLQGGGSLKRRANRLGIEKLLVARRIDDDADVVKLLDRALYLTRTFLTRICIDRGQRSQAPRMLPLDFREEIVGPTDFIDLGRAFRAEDSLNRRTQ